MKDIYLRCDGNLADHVNLAHVLALYKKRGFNTSIRYELEYHPIWDAMSVDYRDGRHPKTGRFPIPYRWAYFRDYNEPVPELDWSGSRLAMHIGRSPLPSLDEPLDHLWEELCGVHIRAKPVGTEIRKQVQGFLDGLPRPIVLIQTANEQGPEERNIPKDAVAPLCWMILSQTNGSVVILDYMERNPVPSHRRIKTLRTAMASTVSHLLGLMEEADALISVDAGPYHLARMTDLPTIGLWPSTYPSCNALPNKNTVNMVSADPRLTLVNIARMPRWNIVEYAGKYPDPKDVTTILLRLLEGPRYLGEDYRGRDAMMQQWVRDWSDVTGLDWLLREIKAKFVEPDIVEVGCVKYRTDWSGKSNSTFLLACLVDSTGGTLTCIDRDTTTVERQCKRWKNVIYLNSDPYVALGMDQGRIDVLYLNEDVDLTNCQGLHERTMVAVNKNGNVTVKQVPDSHVMSL